MQPSIQEKANEKILAQLHQHPGSAGKMFESFRIAKPNEFIKDNPF